MALDSIKTKLSEMISNDHEKKIVANNLHTYIGMYEANTLTKMQFLTTIDRVIQQNNPKHVSNREIHLICKEIKEKA